MKKKLLSLVMVLVLVLTIAPTAAFAENSVLTAYLNFRTPNFAPGSTYLFIPDSQLSVSSDDCLTSLPENATVLTDTEPFEDVKDHISDDYSIVTYVNVTNPGVGFDSCSSGAIASKDGSYYFFCACGDIKAFKGEPVTYDVKTFTSSDITVTPILGELDSTTEVSLAKDDILVMITVNGESYPVYDYSFTDDIINFRAGDDQITLNFGGVNAVARVDMTGMERLVWIEDNLEILEKCIISKDDIPAIDKALNKGESNPEVTEDDMIILHVMLEAAVWLEDYDSALKITNPTYADYEALKNAKEAFEYLPEYSKDYIAEEILSSLDASYKKAKVLYDEFKSNKSNKATETNNNESSKNNTKTTSKVNTGDSSELFLWIVLMLIAAVGAVVTVVYKRKKRVN